jgi:hypothetical protein
MRAEARKTREFKITGSNHAVVTHQLSSSLSLAADLAQPAGLLANLRAREKNRGEKSVALCRTIGVRRWKRAVGRTRWPRKPDWMTSAAVTGEKRGGRLGLYLHGEISGTRKKLAERALCVLCCVFMHGASKCPMVICEGKNPHAHKTDAFKYCAIHRDALKRGFAACAGQQVREYSKIRGTIHVSKVALKGIRKNE